MLSLTFRRVRNRAVDFVHTYRVRRRLLQDHGIARTREFRRPQWHLGARYYDAVLATTGAGVFIKHGWPEMIANEVLAWQRIERRGGARFLARLVSHESAGDFPFAAFERIAGESLSDAIARRDGELLRALADQLVELIDVLDAAQVVHRDVRPANLLVRSGAATLVLIDFALARIPDGPPVDQRLPAAALRTLGAGLNPAPLQWDDAYSALAILTDIESVVGEPLDATNQLRARVGRRVYAAGAA